MTNPADIGTKAFGGKRVNVLLFLMGFTHDSGELGKEEFEAERMKQDQKKRLQEVIRRMVFLEEGASEKSTQSNQLAKRLLRLTMTALLADSALSLAGIAWEKGDRM